MQRADGQGIGTALAGDPRQLFQGLGIAETAISGAAQRVQLDTQAPSPGRRLVHRIGHAVAVLGRHGQGEVLVIDAHGLVTHRHQPGQHGVGVEFEVEDRTVFEVNFTGTVGRKIVRQVQALAGIRGQQRRQVPGLLHRLQLQQALFDFLIGVGGVAEAFEDGAQYARFDPLRTAVGVDPIDGQASSAGQYFQVRIAHGRSPSRGAEGGTAVRLTRAL